MFTLKQFEYYPNLFFENVKLKFVECPKHLGVTLNCKGQWHDHIENILKSASKIIGIMRKLKFSLSRIALNQIYFSYVLPILEYSSIVWDGCSQRDTDILEKLQNEAARIVTGLTRSVSLENFYSECCWIPLSERRRQHKLAFMYNVTNKLVPSYISDLIPPTTRDINRYELRNRDNIAIPFSRTDISQKSCIPSSIALWNNLII